MATSNRMSHSRSRRRQLAAGVGASAALYLLLAYAVIPSGWLLYTARHPALDEVPRITRTADGIPGDPLNVALIGSEAEVRGSFLAAGWSAADPLGLRSDARIATATLLNREYAAAPVSSLYLFGRKEDLAFEKGDGRSPRRRHHVRFWRVEQPRGGMRELWIGGATFDASVGFSHTTGQITHHIAMDVDAERDRLLKDLQQSGRLVESYSMPSFHERRNGRNGGGDRWTTDGRLRIGILRGGAGSSDVAL